MIASLTDKNLLVIGLGLIGGSLAKACRQKKIFASISGFSRKAETMADALSLGLVDEVSGDIEALVSKADVIFLAVPILSTSAVIAQIQPYLRNDTIVTDGGSVKGSVVKAGLELLTDDQLKMFVPGHPIAGSERSGVTAADEHLYVDHRIILTPIAETEPEAVQVVSQMWKSVGAEVDVMAWDYHDEVLAATSHLPHMLAFNLVDTLSKQSENREIFNYAAGGFRDFTRIAASDPTMWHDIFIANHRAILKVLDNYLDELHKLRNAVAVSDGEYMKFVFQEAKEAREHFSEILENRARRLHRSATHE
ncbi:prephenate dehydrogenase/arogenate dehydrogenase family protein [Gynuella sp.]|uniref:prephenate dehydrogenase/arogenate dehydrogenase family protein n=1 Tax=Gynuella sp. TaxID=2969146 RepID=UPI003D11162A